MVIYKERMVNSQLLKYLFSFSEIIFQILIYFCSVTITY